MRPPNVTMEQRNSSRFRFIHTTGALIGVITGCLLGLINLLIIDLERKERRKRQAEIDQIFHLVMDKGPEMFECEAATLFLHDPVEDILWSKITTTKHMVQVPVSEPSVVSHVYKTGEIVEIRKETDSRVNRKASQDFKTRNMLAAPVYMDEKCVAVIEVMNKHNAEAFSKDDVRLLKVLCDHVGMFCATFLYEEHARGMDEPENDNGTPQFIRMLLNKQN